MWGVAAALLMIGGVLLVVNAAWRSARASDDDLAQWLEAPAAPPEAGRAPIDAASLRERLVALTTELVSRTDPGGSMLDLLDRAMIPLRPGELVAVVMALGALGAIVVGLVTEQWLASVATLGVTPFLTRTFLRHRIDVRRRRIEDDLPDAISIVASSMAGGHTFARAIQNLAEQSEGPVAEEFGRVVRETQLGTSIIESLQRMSNRLQLETTDLLADAVRVQTELGGSLGELLHTLAETIRARQELQREIRVLTAEGRMSAWLLGALPPGLLLVLEAISPGYTAPLFTGWGLMWLIGAGVSVALGVGWIRRMSQIEA